MKINNISPDQHNFLQETSEVLQDTPKSLYYIGNLPELPRLTVAIVGTRRPTAYGRTVTEQIASAPGGPWRADRQRAGARCRCHRTHCSTRRRWPHPRGGYQ